jgi:hypothetical protein
MLAYFLSRGQRFALVINVDGFDEVALALINAETGSIRRCGRPSTCRRSLP